MEQQNNVLIFPKLMSMKKPWILKCVKKKDKTKFADFFDLYLMFENSAQIIMKSKKEIFMYIFIMYICEYKHTI